MKLFVPYPYKAIFPTFLLILSLFGQSTAQDYDVTLAQQCNTPNPATNETITFPNTPPNANSDATLTIVYQGDLDGGPPPGTEYLDFLSESLSLLGTTTSQTQCSGIGTFVTTIPMNDIISWAADGQIDFTVDPGTGVNSLTNCVNGLQVGYCVTATLQYGVSTGPNDVGVTQVGPGSIAFCPGIQNIEANIQNYGTNHVSSFTVNWALDGVIQTPIAVTANLDTVNGAGSSDTTILLGTNNFVLGQTYTMEAWTTLPNGVADTTTVNDSASSTLTTTVPGVNALTSLNVLDVSADLSWTELGTATQWEVEYGLQGFTQGSGTSTVTTNNPFSLSGLTPNTWYDFYVRSICGPGDTSTWTGPGQFLTTCALVSTPFLESFDGNTFIPGSVFSNTNDVMDQCWSRNPTVGLVWRVSTTNNLNNHSGSTAPAADVSGSGNFVYVEVSGGGNGDSTFLESPWIDASATTAPVLTFWTHFFGTTTGTMLAQMSNDGQNWTTLWSQTGQQQFSSTDPWIEQTVNAAAFGGDTVKIRFVGISIGCCSGDMSIDQVRLRQPPPIDLGIVAIDSPSTNCGLSATEPVTVRFFSGGFDTITAGTNINVHYRINGGATVTETYTPTADILNGDTITYDFTTKANLSVPQNYDFEAWVSIPGDGDATNDTTAKTVISIPVITSYPYFENFESGQGGWTSGGFQDSWGFGTPAKNNIQGASSGVNAWVTGGTGVGGYNNGETSFIVGPCFDMSAINQPIIKLDVWWSSDFSWDGTQIQSSTDGGTTWNTVGAFGDPDNWYNDNTIDGINNAGFFPGEGWTGVGTTSSNGWLNAKNDLTGLGGNNAVLLRVFFGAFFGGFNDGVAIDNFTVLETPNRDIGLISIDSAQTGCALGTSETVAVTYSNFGLDTLATGDTIPFSYNVDGGAVTTENLILVAPLFPGDTNQYIFTAGANLGTFATYTIKAWPGLSGDGDPSNDTIDKIVTSVPVINSYPYTENFESGNGGWTSGGTADTWAYGTPAKNQIIGASSGTNAWVTGGLGTTPYNNGEASFIVGPCFDMSSLALPVVKTDAWWNSEFSWDGAQLQASTDGGATWQQIGNFGDPDNWYNDNTIDGLLNAGFLGEGWSGSGPTGSGGWVTAKNTMTGYGGQSDVFLRIFFGSDGSVNTGFDGVGIDDFVILETPANDLAIISIDTVQTGCAMGSMETVAITYANLGINPIAIGDTVFFGYDVDAANAVNEMSILTAPVLPGDTTFYVFNTTSNLSAFATYTIRAWTALPGEEDPTNDTTDLSVTNVPVINTFPYLEDFESGNGGWTSGGNNNTWAYGIPNKATIDTAASGSNAWVTGGLNPGPYNNSEQSFVVGPCFDFTNIVRPEFDLNLWWNAEFSWDGAQLQASTNGGLSWQQIGAFGDPNNWYTDNTVAGISGGGSGFSGDGWSGDSFGWVTASNISSTLGGQSDVFLRVFFGSDGSVNTGFDGVAFDDFGVEEDALADDMQIDSLLGIPSGCGLSATTPIRVLVRNYGLNTQSNIPISYSIGGVVQATETIAGPLVGGQTILYQFAATADLSGPGNYLITAEVDLLGDLDSTNNFGGPVAVVSYQVPMVTSFQGSEQCVPGPTSITATPDVGVIRWYDVPSGGTPIFTGNTLSIPNLTSTTTYYAEPHNTGVIPCTGPRQSVVAELSSVPSGVGFSFLQTAALTIEFTSSLPGNVDSVWWDFGDLGAGSDQLNPTHVYSSGGTKGVVLQAFDGSCDTSVSQAIFVTALENSLANEVEVFPNPTQGSFKFEASNLGESLKLQLIDQKGVVILEEVLKSFNGRYDATLEFPKETPAGIYHLKVIDGERIGRIKVVKE